ncbi:hypothetical protein EHQ43_17590 [Leptospira bouyouniensis]|uniref:Uncharacterized protein n=1 Tax=Leptospira bouyouniensis TaxID=2484911 RepID=A0A7I0HN13_9LEPT|nr:hypothetical protein [Leptospira bouyouniensis]TGL02172.1 hypothetical protein EHQ43_17590 [Leptospira bouyouniensis]
MIIKYIISTYQSYSRENTLNVYKAYYDFEKDLKIFNNETLILHFETEQLNEILEKKFSLPGLDLINLKKYSKIQDYVFELNGDYFEDILNNFLLFTHIINFSFQPTGNDISNLLKFFSDNVGLFFNGKFNKAIPFSYYIPINSNNNNIPNLFQKGFLNKFSIQFSDTPLNEFQNYYKPYVTPLAKAFLNDSERTLFYWFLQKADLILKRIPNNG